MRKKNRRFNKNKKGKIFIGQWLAFKPYTIHSRYDLYYIDRANEVLDIMNEYEEYWEKQGISEGNRQILAVLLVSRFEDFINEIGLWQVFIQHNQQTFGYYLPFYDMANYDADYLNPADFSYQIWHQLSAFDIDYYYDPDKPEIISIGKKIYDFLEAKIDEAPVTDFYDKYFDLTKKTNFFDIKERLLYLIDRSYLLGGGAFQPRLAAELQKHMSEHKKDTNLGLINFMMIQNEYLYNKCSPWGGLSARAWLIGVSKLSNELKEKIQNSWKNIISIFQLEGLDEKYYYLKHHSLKTVFKVERASFKMPKEAQGYLYHMMTIVKWGEEWWMSGTNLPIPPEGRDMIEQEYKVDPIFFAYPLSVQQKNEAHTQQMTNDMLAYAGKAISVFENGKEYDEFMTKFTQFSRKKINERNKAAGKPLETFSPIPTNQHENLPFDTDDGVGVAVIENMGYIIFGGIQSLKRLSEIKHPTKEKQNELLELFLDSSYQPKVIEFFVKNYSLDNLPYFSSKSKVKFGDNILYLHQFYNTEEYEEMPPLMIYRD